MLPFILGGSSLIGEIVKNAALTGVGAALGYKSGYNDGEIAGYERASREYEKKLRSQADAFLSQKNKWMKEKEEYEALLDEYEKTIEELQACIKQSYSDEYQPILNDVVRYRNKLARLSA